ncbi:hypothetical protein AVEN_136995-1 [Araneus ventricosus]|uniref:Uncharacterized protein n=1 Tax=Araneus ventricosus TaxID=182803 RepID=A0A4Y2NDC6_ARAVE|nr:hypothetical protein AVEN_136995-1 [Araneus ventricosus]
MAPGAMHQARWMSKMLYYLKIWMFSCQFTITPTEEKGLQKICIFAIHVYLKAWMTASLPQNAPYNDFNLMKSLLKFKKIDEEIRKVASEKLANHLWYLSEDLVALALFDNQVSHCIKKQMIKAMKEVNGKNLAKRPDIKLKNFMDMKFEDFVTKRSALLFNRMSLPDTFLHVDPQIWEHQEDYCKALKIIEGIPVVNDHAERGIALIKEFNGKITHFEDQLQFLLQVIEEHRRMYPDCKKQSLAGAGTSTYHTHCCLNVTCIIFNSQNVRNFNKIKLNVFPSSSFDSFYIYSIKYKSTEL